MKKIIVLLVVILMTVSFCGCKDNLKENYVTIPNTKNMEYITTNHQVIIRTGYVDNSVGVPCYYHNYVVYYSSDKNTFYYYNKNEEIITITLKDLSNAY